MSVWTTERKEIATWLSGYLAMIKKWVDKILDNEDHDVDKNKIITPHMAEFHKIFPKIKKSNSNIQKIKEAFGPGSSNPKKSAAKKKKFPDLTGDGKVTFADILKGRGVKRG